MKSSNCWRSIRWPAFSNRTVRTLARCDGSSTTVTCAPSGKQKPTAAYLLMSEPFELTGQNAVQVVKLDLVDAGQDKVAVTVPSVLFWKMVVFQFEEP